MNVKVQVSSLADDAGQWKLLLLFIPLLFSNVVNSIAFVLHIRKTIEEEDMKVELGFLNYFRCAYNNSLPICADEWDTQIGTCKMTVENNKYIGDLCFDDANAINENFYLWCKWHIAENELLTIDKICLTKEVANDDFSIRLKNAIADYN